MIGKPEDRHMGKLNHKVQPDDADADHGSDQHAEQDDPCFHVTHGGGARTKDAPAPGAAT